MLSIFYIIEPWVVIVVIIIHSFFLYKIYTEQVQLKKERQKLYASFINTVFKTLAEMLKDFLSKQKKKEEKTLANFTGYLSSEDKIKILARVQARTAYKRIIAKIFLFCSVIALVASFVMGTNVSAFTVLKVIIGLWVFYALVIVLIGLLVFGITGFKKLWKKQ